MKTSLLGNTSIPVSRICLGTMTWGEQNTEAQAHAQMDYAVERGINFFDAAEMYPVPPKPETQGRTEDYIGTWFKKSGKRDKIILATKVVGRSAMFAHLGRGDETRLTRQQIFAAIDASLKRLQTDHIDLYQLHWPDRSVNNFGQLTYQHSEQEHIPILETLEVLGELVQQGKVRHIGLSNETSWGMMEFIRRAEQHDLPRVVSIQNPYNLLNRSFEVGLAEMAIRERCGLLAYSPLAFGMLTGKYAGGKMPEGSRLTIYSRFQRYNNPRGFAATEKYVKLARDHGLSPAQMALAFVNQQPFVTSNIIGATTLEQLKENIDSSDVVLSDEVLKGIEEISREHTFPCP